MRWTIGTGPRISVAFLAAVLLMSSCESQTPRSTPGDQPSSIAPPQPSNGKVAFQSDRDQREGIFGIYTMSADGGELTRLVQGEASTPQWSPDGKQIAYIRTTDLEGNLSPSAGLYIANSDGSGEKKVSETAVNNYEFSWSGDGKKLVFTGGSPPGRGGPRPGVYVVNADGSGERKLTDSSEEESGPSWSPDGKRISFSRIVEGPSGTQGWVVNDDGSAAVNIGEGISSPAWAPDGMKLAYLLTRRSAENPEGTVFTVSPDGTGATSVAKGQLVTWWPDGRLILRRYPGEFFLSAADGTDQKKLAWPSDICCITPSPDQKSVVFVRRVNSPSGRGTEDQPDIFVMDADGANPVNLTNNSGQDTAPSWQSVT